MVVVFIKIKHPSPAGACHRPNGPRSQGLSSYRLVGRARASGKIRDPGNEVVGHFVPGELTLHSTIKDMYQS